MQIGASLPEHRAPSLGIAVVSWVVVMVPILLFGSVLHPAPKTAPAIGRDTLPHHVV